ncbi:hypothetical protein EDD18DRAFT_1134609 [Armillaria luteobubalina]|uniref:Knr4/Smi1-like domain-containing protein n=1 Tax=Armillaria luteobubalina TaxID=153913 RepID=A0AA39QI32_9AGAR|nr:hypothetical protein EDD18DRAFT_1134609 [Armillaria luteobubalina]
MNWLASFFSSGSSQNLRKGQAISSTHDAFSIPSSSPIFSLHPDVDTPDPETATSGSYTYPPASPGSYAYIPTSNGSNSRSASLLPMHHDPLHTPFSPSSAYPSLTSTWNRLRTWLAREYPELGDTLNYGILPEDLAHIELQFGFALPSVVRESYLIVDGQEAESAAGCSEGLFFGLNLLPLEEVYEEWRFWREVDDDPMTGANARLRSAMQSIPPNWIRKEYSQRGWIPLIADKAGNYIGVDLNPGEAGAVGQVIVFGRDFDTKVVLFNGDGITGWAKWLASFVDELESGDGFEIGASNDASDGSEDDIGYESYFYDGSGRGQGDGGGDTYSGGGLRLTGEYRGWSVLEAWADRSVRRWFDIGVIAENMDDQDFEKAPEKMDLGVLEMSQGSGSEVPIPVFADVDEPSIPPIASSSNVNITSSRKTPPNLPTIAVTKPPAPLPVELPTPRDIVSLPSPPDSTHSSFDEDLEAGRGRPLALEQDASLVSSSRRSELADDLPDPTGPTVLIEEPEALLPATPPQEISETLSSPTDIHDLLADSAPVLTAEPMQPVTPSSRPEIPNSASDLIIDTSDTLKPETDRLQAPMSVDVDADPTVRLVGGGGSGTAEPPPDAEENHPTIEAVDSDAASMISEPGVSSSNAGDKKHKKSKSGLAGFKKHLGGLRKKNSVSSVKEVQDST